jgi:hypothetical protein
VSVKARIRVTATAGPVSGWLPAVRTKVTYLVSRPARSGALMVQKRSHDSYIFIT